MNFFLEFVFFCKFIVYKDEENSQFLIKLFKSHFSTHSAKIFITKQKSYFLEHKRIMSKKHKSSFNLFEI